MPLTPAQLAARRQAQLANMARANLVLQQGQSFDQYGMLLGPEDLAKMGEMGGAYLLGRALDERAPALLALARELVGAAASAATPPAQGSSASPATELTRDAEIGRLFCRAFAVTPALALTSLRKAAA